MKKPDPEQGLVIRYDYLWHDEAERGRQEGAKDRPCAIVVARTGEGQEVSVMLAPITHTAPSNPKGAIEIPQKVKRYLGLDDARSWIITNELNTVAWNDAGIVPAKPGLQWEYGRLPNALWQPAVDTIREMVKDRRVKMVDRTRSFSAYKTNGRPRSDGRGR